LDKRYYVPLISDFSNFSNVFVSDLFVKNDSIFYKTSFLRAKEAIFRKNNLFFYEKDSYDSFDVNFINYQIFPNRGSVDLYKNKIYNRKDFSYKPKMMSFKIYLDNHLTLFEKFYLENELFLADSFEYSKDDFFFKGKHFTDIVSVLKDKKIADPYDLKIFENFHPKVRSQKPAVEPDNINFKFIFKDKRFFSRKKELPYNVCLDFDLKDKIGNRQHNLKFKHFRLPKGFFRNTSKKSDTNYSGFLDYKFKGFKIRPSFIFNDRFKWIGNYNYDFVFHNLFSYFRDYFS